MKHFIKFKQKYTDYAYISFNYWIKWVILFEWIFFINISFSNNILEILEHEISFILNFTVSSPHWIFTARISTFNLDFSFVQKS